MPLLRIHHKTEYRYARPVAFGEHRIMVRPSDSHDLRLFLAELEITPKPASLRWTHVYGAALLCGVGFTMSLFIGSLAYSDAVRYEEAVLGIFVASVVSALLGLAWLRVVLPARAEA